MFPWLEGNCQPVFMCAANGRNVPKEKPFESEIVQNCLAFSSSIKNDCFPHCVFCLFVAFLKNFMPWTHFPFWCDMRLFPFAIFACFPSLSKNNVPLTLGSSRYLHTTFVCAPINHNEDSLFILEVPILIFTTLLHDIYFGNIMQWMRGPKMRISANGTWLIYYSLGWFLMTNSKLHT